MTYWVTVVLNKLIAQDQQTYNYPDWLVNEMIEEFKSLATVRTFVHDIRMDHIVVAPGMYSMKVHSKRHLKGHRGLVMVFRAKETGNRGTLVLAGIFPRCNETYESILRDRMKEIRELG